MNTQGFFTIILSLEMLGRQNTLQQSVQSSIHEREKRDTTSGRCLDRYRVIPHHTMCLANMTQQPVSQSDQDGIVSMHNKIRGDVNPAAANMLKMSYDSTLETLAQIWAEQCKLTHEHYYRRFLPGRYQVGQNIVTSKVKIPWDDAIDVWKNEAKHFRYGKSGNQLKKVGHYTQVVWATTVLVGCGMAKCGDTYFYVCDYGPGGNVQSVDKPYTEGVNNKSCSACKSNCQQNLCDCGGKVCYNDGNLDQSTCQCTCKKGLKLYNNPNCELECIEGGDSSLCGHSPYDKSHCSKNTFENIDCPWLCDICPYAGKNYTEGSVPLPSSGSSIVTLTFWAQAMILTLSLDLF